MSGQQPDVAPLLQQIQTDSQDTITAIRDTVWALNPDNDAPGKFLERLRAVAFQLLAHQDVHVTFETKLPPHTLPVFSMEQRRHIYFVYKEALHNIVKHAQATDVRVSIFRHLEQLNIQIKDDGVGYGSIPTGDGNGLKNFHKRGTDGHFKVVVCSEPGKGTTVDIQIPLPKLPELGMV